LHHRCSLDHDVPGSAKALGNPGAQFQPEQVLPDRLQLGGSGFGLATGGPRFCGALTGPIATLITWLALLRSVFCRETATPKQIVPAAAIRTIKRLIRSLTSPTFDFG
jgi:hypothetical protein